MHCCTVRKVIVFLLAVMFLSAARQASAELIFFAADRAMSVKTHRFEGDAIIVTLRSGGEMTFDRSLITKIGPDEVPYDEPSVVADAEPETPAQIVSTTTYDRIIQSASTRHGVPVRLVKAVIQVESGYEPRARSARGAMGLMQLMPETARQYGATKPYDPRSNIEAGVKYLRTLLDQFELPLALAAYNAGEAAVRRFGGIPPFPETQDYVRKIRALVR
jgi:soluble lytic murein transglycosylase-like protein